MKKTKSILFLIDLQVGNINHLYNAESVLKANTKVLKFAKANGIEVLHFKYHEQQRDIRFGKSWTTAETPEGQFHTSVIPRPTEKVFTKPAYGAFSISELDDYLKSQDVETIWLTGVMSQVCVLTTAYEAYARRYHVNVITEAVGATSIKNLDLGLEWMRKYVADLKTIDDFRNFLEARRGDASA